MTNSRSSSDQHPGASASGQPTPGTPAPKPRRGPRRATAPAGPPRISSGQPALLTVGTDAAPLPETSATHTDVQLPLKNDGGPQPSSAPPALADGGVDNAWSEAETVADSEAGDKAEGEAEADPRTEPEAEGEAETVADPGVEPEADPETDAAAETVADADDGDVAQPGSDSPADTEGTGRAEAEIVPDAAAPTVTAAKGPRDDADGDAAAPSVNAEPDAPNGDAASDSQSASGGGTAESPTVGDGSVDPAPESTLAEGTEPDAGSGLETGSATGADSSTDTKSELETGSEPTEPDAGDPVAAPLSRRERRIAEQGRPDGVEPLAGEPQADQPAWPGAAAAPGVAPALPAGADTSGRSSGHPGRRHRKRGWSLLRGVLLFLVIAAVVVAMGTVVTGNGAGSAKASATESNRSQAWEATESLLAQATALAGPASGASTATLPAGVVSALQIQSAALSDGIPTASAQPKSTATTGPRPTLADFNRALAASANTLLEHALTAEGAMGRVFASAGTGQLLQARTIARENGLPVPDSPALPANSRFDAATGPACQATLTPSPGANADNALTSAAQSEQKAVYAYQVAGSRLVGQAHTQALAILAVHSQRLELLNAQLAVSCLPIVAGAPGFVLDPRFTAQPEQALAQLEQQLAAAYGDLAALSSPSTTPAGSFASSQPSTGAARATDAATAAGSASGSASGPDGGTPASARAMAVSWLLESSLTAQAWGGNASPLPGIAVTPTATATAAPSSGASGSAPGGASSTASDSATASAFPSAPARP